MDVIWVHLDAVSRTHPVFGRSPDARAVFVWDAADLERRGWTLKRCVFLHECVTAMDVEIVAGDPVDVLSSLGADRVLCAETPNPALQAVMDALPGEVVRVAARPFTDVPANTDMGRFFRFWNSAKRSALRRTDEIA